LDIAIVTKAVSLIVASLLSVPLGIAATLAHAGCAFEPQGEGHVVEIVDGKTLRLSDGREIRLAGIEPAASSRAALSTITAGRDVTLRGNDDVPAAMAGRPPLCFSLHPIRRYRHSCWRRARRWSCPK
jgi:hypothetical protein